MAAKPEKQIKAVAYIGKKNSSGELTNIRRWDDISALEQIEISRKLQIQCAKSVGYVLAEEDENEKNL